MPAETAAKISLRGTDFANVMREIELEHHLWQKVCNWHGSPDRARDWVQQQIKLFSSRHTEKQELSQVIASVAFVEMVNPLCPRYPLSGRNTADEPAAGQRRLVGH